MNITRRDTLKLTAAALASSALPQSVFAQAWPTRGIRAMVPFAAGSSLDIVGRIVLDPLATQLGQSIVVENRGGAGGSIGTAQVAKSDPDGYTILIQASAHSAAPAAYPNITYDPAGRLHRGHPVRHGAERDSWSRRRRGFKIGDGAGGRRQGQGRQVHLRLGRRRQRHALGR